MIISFMYCCVCCLIGRVGFNLYFGMYCLDVFVLVCCGVCVCDCVVCGCVVVDDVYLDCVLLFVVVEIVMYWLCVLCGLCVCVWFVYVFVVLSLFDVVLVLFDICVFLMSDVCVCGVVDDFSLTCWSQCVFCDNHVFFYGMSL